MPIYLDARKAVNHPVLRPRYLPSANHNERPTGVDISAVVIHGISLPPGQFGGPWISDLFLNRLDPSADPAFREIAAMQVSAHMLIRRDGALLQFVPLLRRAWHAGVSSLDGISNCNDYSIGIELEGSDNEAYSAEQYQQLALLLPWLQQRWPQISTARIVGHSDIAPGRKTDPGPAFDWLGLRRLLSDAAMQHIT